MREESKLRKSVPIDFYGKTCFCGDEVTLFDNDGHEINATFSVDNYLNWQFEFDKENSKKAAEFLSEDCGDFGLPFGEYIDEFSSDWNFKLRQFVRFGTF